MNHPALDAYLDELLDLTVDAVAPAPVAANAPVMAVADEPASDTAQRVDGVDEQPLPLHAGGGWEGVSGAQAPGSDSQDAADFAPLQPHGHQAQPDGVRHDAPSVENMTMSIDAGLLAELDNDPLFAALEPTAVPNAAPAVPQIDPGLLAELDSDPLFAAVLASNEASAPSAPAIDPGLLAELDSDPLFAAALASNEASMPDAPAIDPALLAELDSDPLFAALMAEPATPAPPRPIAPPKPAPPAPRAAMPPADPRSGLRPIEMTPPALTHSVTTTHRWLRVAVGEDSYAVELLRVQEVGRTVPIVAMRGAAPSVLGAMNLRGRIVPVFDLGLWLGTGRVTPDERARIVVVERDNELIGALVTAVDDVVTLGPDRIEPPLMASPSRAIVGVARVVAKPTVLLDANALFG